MPLYCSASPALSAGIPVQLSRALTMFWSRSARSYLRSAPFVWIQLAMFVPGDVGIGPSAAL